MLVFLRGWCLKFTWRLQWLMISFCPGIWKETRGTGKALTLAAVGPRCCLQPWSWVWVLVLPVVLCGPRLVSSPLRTTVDQWTRVLPGWPSVPGHYHFMALCAQRCRFSETWLPKFGDMCVCGGENLLFYLLFLMRLNGASEGIKTF